MDLAVCNKRVSFIHSFIDIDIDIDIDTDRQTDRQTELVLHTFWNVQPVQVGVQQTRQTTIEFASTD